MTNRENAEALGWRLRQTRTEPFDLRDHNPNLLSALALLEPGARDLRFLRTVGDR